MKARKKYSERSVKDRWKSLVDCIADLLGEGAEVVLHDVHHPERSVVYIRNGHITGRKIGAPLTDLGFLMLREARKGKDTLGVYQSKTDTGKQLKCNAILLRDDQHVVTGMLCINIDITGTTAATMNGHKPPEHYHTNVSQVIETLISDASERADLPAGELSTAEKMKIITSLHLQGVFLARGAVKQVSSRLGIATSTVYKYIQCSREPAPRIRH